MTLKSSSWKNKQEDSSVKMADLMRENGKRRIWLFALLSFIMVCGYPITMALNLSRSNIENIYARQEFAFGLLGLDNIFTLFLLTIGGIVCAANGFSWLYSRKKTDMYFSRPVPVMKHFFSVYANGILIFFVPYFVSVLLSIFVAAGMEAFSGALLAEAAFNIITSVIYFLAIYHLMLIAVFLTGTKVTASLLGGVFILYDNLFRTVLDEYCRLYFATYSGYTSLPDLFSPVYRFISVCEKDMFIWKRGAIMLSEVWEKQMRPMLPGILGLFVEAVILGGLACYCYKNRPAEACGKAIAYKAVKGPLKVCLIFLFGLLGSCIFCDVANNTKPYIALSGMAIGILLCQAVSEMLYESDVRAFAAHKKSFLAGTAAVLLFHFIFAADIFGYDTWIPQAEQVESAAIQINFQNRGFVHLDENNKMTWDGAYELNEMKIKDVSGILSLARDGMGKDRPEQNAEKQRSCILKYRMKNGKEKYREFFIDYEKEQRVLDILFANEDYKRGSNQVLDERLDTFYAASRISYSNGLGAEEVPDKNALALIQEYRKDLLELSFTDVMEAHPCGVLEVTCTDEYGMNNTLEYPVFPTCQRTIAYLEKKGAMIYPELKAEMVDSVKIESYNEVYQDEEIDTGMNVNGLAATISTTSTTSEMKLMEAEYKEREQIEEILQCVYPSYLGQWRYLPDKLEENIKVTFITSGGEDIYSFRIGETNFTMDSKKIPEFVREDLKL